VLVRLELPYADVAAGDLSLRLDAPGRAGLESLSLAVGGFVVELRLLGSSHQAVVDGGRLCETVACAPGPAPGLPSRSRRRAADVAYDFVARVVRLDATAYAQRAHALVAAAAADPRGLVGVFPGHDGAFTSLQVLEHPRGAAWVTWHGYPQTGELVRTRSTIARR
jgi:Protein of unknown function DUF2617